MTQARVVGTGDSADDRFSTGAITEDPVPYVAFAVPTWVQPCPNRAACKSASTARIGVPSGTAGTFLVVPKPASEATAAGSVAAGTPKTLRRSSLQSRPAM